VADVRVEDLKEQRKLPGVFAGTSKKEEIIILQKYT
jgi:hypothetical protein